MIIDTDKYVDAVSAAEILGVTRTRVSALVKANRLGETVRVGHTRLIPRDEVMGFERLTPGVKKKPANKEVVAEALRENSVATGGESTPVCGDIPQ